MALDLAYLIGIDNEQEGCENTWEGCKNTWERNEKVVQLLLEAGADPNDSMEGWRTILQMASCLGDESTLKHFLEAKADPNLQCEGDLRSVRSCEMNSVSAIN